MWPQVREAKECQQQPEAGRGKEGLSPGGSEGSAALLTPCFWPPDW